VSPIRSLSGLYVLVAGMYLIMAYCFAAFTAIMMAGLLWLGWQHNREEVRREKERRETFTRR
jgi:hypothetical protein